MKKLTMATLLSSSVFLSGCSMLPTGDVAEGVRFQGKDLSGATKEQVVAAVEAYAKTTPKTVVLIGRNGERQEVPLKDLGISVQVDGTVEAIRQYGYESDVLELIKRRYAALNSPYVVEPKIGVQENTFQAFVKNYMAEHTTSAANGTLSVEGERVIYTPPKMVEVVDEEAMQKAILAVVRGETSGPITVQFKQVSGETEQMRQMKVMNTILSSYTTYFNPDAVGRSKNIALAVQKVTGTLLKPGEIFSYNAVVGERTSAEGYEMAPVYINGKLEPGIGGGICQVSSTLFAAALYAGMDMVERTTHFEPVAYMPVGMDATVSYGYLDFVFRNSLTKPVYILAEMYGNALTIYLLGSKEDKLSSASVYEVSRMTTPHGTLKKLLEEGEKEGTVEGHDGITTIHERKLVKADGTVMIDSYESDYEPVDTVIIQSPATIKAEAEKKSTVEKKVVTEKKTTEEKKALDKKATVFL